MQTNNNNTNLGLFTKTKSFLLQKRPSVSPNLQFVPSPNKNIRKGFVVKAKKVEDD